MFITLFPVLNLCPVMCHEQIPLPYGHIPSPWPKMCMWGMKSLPVVTGLCGTQLFIFLYPKLSFYTIALCQASSLTDPSNIIILLSTFFWGLNKLFKEVARQKCSKTPGTLGAQLLSFVFQKQSESLNTLLWLYMKYLQLNSNFLRVSWFSL